MLEEEAVWLANWLYRLPVNDVFPLCNLGSSTLEFRENDQPFIDQLIFKPARNLGLPVVHVDLRWAPGVDMVGDISDPDFCQRLSRQGFKSVLCSNLLEHVKNPKELSASLTSIIPIGGYLMVTVPNKYPYHPDPIDNGFRPTPRELADLFINTQAVAAEIITSQTFKDDLKEEPTRIIKWLARLTMPYYHPKEWLSDVAIIPYLFKNYKVTCFISRRTY